MASVENPKSAIFHIPFSEEYRTSVIKMEKVSTVLWLYVPVNLFIFMNEGKAD